MKQWWRDRRPYVLSSAIFVVARAIGRTLRFKTEGWEKVKDLPSGKIYCGWHGRSMIPANFFKGRGVWAIISHSRDGEMQTRIFTKFGFRIIRGSTGRGGERALVESIRVLRKGEEMAITPDGPRGPAHIVQGGVMMMARKSGCALIPVGSSSRRAYYAPTWDRYLVPWFFSRVSFVFGEPVYVPADADEATVESLRLKLQEQIGVMQERAEELVGARPPEDPPAAP